MGGGLRVRNVLWWLVAGAGVALMIWAYRADRPADQACALCVRLDSCLEVRGQSAVQADPAKKIGPLAFPAAKGAVRPLPLGMFPSVIVAGISKTDAERGRRLEFHLSEKVFELPLTEAGITERVLAWGRLPRSGQSEARRGVPDPASGCD